MTRYAGQTNVCCGCQAENAKLQMVDDEEYLYCPECIDKLGEISEFIFCDIHGCNRYGFEQADGTTLCPICEDNISNSTTQTGG